MMSNGSRRWSYFLALSAVIGAERTAPTMGESGPRKGSMKHILVALSALCLPLISALTVFGQATPAQPDLMPIEDVRAGMKGYGMTVFQGARPERFEVEVLGVLNGVPNPKQCSVVARLGGPLVERTGVFAGMSGSPVYIDGKLVGAVAFTFPFSKEPIAGITPIKYMIDNFDRGNDQQPHSGKNVSFNTLIAMAEEASRPASAGGGTSPGSPSGFAAGSGAGAAMVPIATPVSFSGIAQPVIDYFAGDLKKLGIQ